MERARRQLEGVEQEIARYQADIVDLLGSDGVGAVPQVSELNAKVEKLLLVRDRLNVKLAVSPQGRSRVEESVATMQTAAPQPAVWRGFNGVAKPVTGRQNLRKADESPLISSLRPDLLQNTSPPAASSLLYVPTSTEADRHSDNGMLSRRVEAAENTAERFKRVAGREQEEARRLRRERDDVQSRYHVLESETVRLRKELEKYKRENAELRERCMCLEADAQALRQAGRAEAVKQASRAGV